MIDHRTDLDERWYQLDSKVKRLRSAELSALLVENKIEHILLKGVAVERFYPPDIPRPSVDIDCAINPKQFKRALKLQEEKRFPSANIDLHKGLGYYSVRPWDDIYRQTKMLSLEEGNVRILRNEDQLRLICIHWLADGAERQDRLRDIGYILENIGDNIDWKYLLDIEDSARKSYCLVSIKAAVEFLGVPTTNFPEFVRDFEQPRWITDTLEDRWSDEVTFKPLDAGYESYADFFRQLKRRFPPNPLMAAVALNQDLKSISPRVTSWRYFFSRVFPSTIRSMRTIGSRRNARHTNHN